MNTIHKLKIVIADDQQPLREMIRSFLEYAPEFVVVGEAVDGLDAIRQVDQLNPDVLLLDIHMPIMDGLETLDILRQAKNDLCIIVLSAFENIFFVHEAITKGAKGYIMKDEITTHLFAAIHDCVYRNKLFISPSFIQNQQF